MNGRKIESNFNFSARILFIEVETFYKYGITNIRNEHFWERENPHPLRDDSCRMVHRHILPTQCMST